MERVTVIAEPRVRLGSVASRQTRHAGLIPAVIYGRTVSPESVCINGRELVKMIHKFGTKVIVDLKVKKNGVTDDRTVIIKDIQFEIVRDGIVHIDFQQISLTEKIRVSVPLITRGDADSPGVKSGGVLEHLVREVEIESLPTLIPKQITVDVAALNIGDVLCVRDLKVPEGVTLVTDPELPVVSVKMVLEEKPAEAPAEEGAAAEPEVIKQKKPEAEAAAEEGKAKAKK
ncbi:MAG: 50S ribosomal protein L25 [Candidatus Omnitrophica bacterium]|nr:50S ribosomal protein L25 [Candidatus Omnitrophota bacterium]